MGKMCRIAIVEDNQIDLFIIKKFLHKEKNICEVVEFTSSEEAIKYFQSNPWQVDLIITDLNMPGQSGHEVIRSVRANEEHSDVPIAVLTSSDSDKDVERAQENGADHFLTKPLTFEKTHQLLAMVTGRG
jgi:CheY-like chemotaxis protein